MTSTRMDPVALAVDFVSGNLSPATSKVERRLSDMRGMYADTDAEAAALADGNPLIYEVLQYDVPPEPGQLFICTTVIHPGKVGREYYMTKGHRHEASNAAEVYVGLSGRGMLLMQVDDQCSSIEMQPRTVAYVPPTWAHRTVNVGTEPFVFLAIYPGDAGHDYQAIEREGFRQRVIEKDDHPALV